MAFQRILDSTALNGQTVIEIANAISGPFAGKLLGDNGAYVLKVEPVTGDNYRKRNHYYDNYHDHDGFTYRFLEYNTSKDSIALDLKTERGKEILWDLIDEADILLENLRVGALDRLGFSWEELHQRTPELIYCSITGYGAEGPYAEFPAYDPVVQGVSGWADQFGDNSPKVVNLWAIDHTTAIYAVLGTLMALLERNIRGKGQQIEVPMLEAAVSFLGHQLAEYSGTRHQDDLEPTFEIGGAPMGIFEAKSGHLALAITTDIWPNFCSAINKEGWLDDSHEFSTLDGRLEYNDQLREDIEEVLARKTADEWIAHFTEHAPSVVCSPVNRMNEVPDDQQIQYRDSIQKRSHPIVGDYLIPTSPIRFSRSETVMNHAPQLGEHTDEVLKALDYSSSDIQDLRDNGIVR